METKIPQTKNEAFAQLDEMLSEKDKKEIANGDAIEYHFSLGMWIRNNKRFIDYGNIERV